MSELKKTQETMAALRNELDKARAEIATLKATDQQPKPPNRQLELKIEIGADDTKALIRLLEHFQEQIVKGSQTCVSGGYESGGSFSIERHVEQTHDKWETELEQYLAAMDKGKSKGPAHA